ncbi:MAG: Lrp/AsnC family transcriptional regulator [Candidatus Heimdallarchaeota archaeon]|nr:Lrp/AsnC family transcriptional regulator [Candidatus Heimdallarchaeota archaeon]
MPIKNKDVPLVLSLMEQPNASEKIITDEINQRLQSSLAISTINRRIKRLEEENIIIGSAAQLNHQKLGLVIHSFIVYASRTPSWDDNISIIEKLCFIHPYTSYSNRVFGSSNGIFLRFRLPENDSAYTLLIELFDILKSKGIIEKYRDLETGFNVFSNNISLKKFDVESNSWRFNANSLEDVFFSDHSDEYIDLASLRDTSILYQLNMADIIIIREMARNSRRSQLRIMKDILGPKQGEKPRNKIYKEYETVIEDFPKSKQSFSRKLKQIEENEIITGYRLLYNREEFGVFNQALFIGKADEKMLGNLLFAFKNDILPFDSALYYSENTFMIWINIPPIELLALIDKLNNFFEDLEVYFMARQSFIYYLWHENFDDENKSWKVNRKWMIDDVLSSLKLSD